jgi:hypothetical protein
MDGDLDVDVWVFPLHLLHEAFGVIAFVLVGATGVHDVLVAHVVSPLVFLLT